MRIDIPTEKASYHESPFQETITHGLTSPGEKKKMRQQMRIVYHLQVDDAV